MEPRWTVYCHTHVESGRRYIGLTKKTILQRWNQHVYSASHRPVGKKSFFWAAIRKYGPRAFSHEVLEVCDTVEAGNAAEEKWILHFETRNHSKGFNLMRGGAHTPHPVSNGYRSDPEYLAGQREAAKERWKDPSYRSKTLAATRAAISTPEVRKKLSDAVSSLWEDPAYRESQTDALKARASDPAHRERIAKLWDNPEFRERCSAGPRRRAEERRSRNRCDRGHELTPENTVVGSRGIRECRACNNARRKGARTHCPRGHEYSEENTVVTSSGRRRCATCLAASKGPRPCSKCGGPKDMRVGSRFRCRPCTNGRISAWRKAARPTSTRPLNPPPR